MTVSQKTAWIQLIIFGLLIIGWVALFIINGTVFFWEDPAMKDTFYYLCAGALAMFLGMTVAVGIGTYRRNNISDERDRIIFRKASLWAVATAFTAIALLLLIISIIYMNQGAAMISVYFPLYIVLVGAVILLFTQAIVGVILYGKKVRHD